MTTRQMPQLPSQWHIATLRCTAYCIILSMWTQKVLLDPLKADSLEMAHMDPTEIVVVPLPLSTLVTFVGFSVGAMFLVSVPWWELSALWTEIQSLTAFSLCMLAISILCGADPRNNIIHTIVASMYVASLISLNPSTFCDDMPSELSLHWHEQWLRRITVETATRDDKMGACRFHVTLLTTIPFQILQILDWGAQVQRWPIPIVLGSTVGWIMGTILGLLWALCTSSSTTAATTKSV